MILDEAIETIFHTGNILSKTLTEFLINPFVLFLHRPA